VKKETVKKETTAKKPAAKKSAEPEKKGLSAVYGAGCCMEQICDSRILVLTVRK